MKAIRFLAAALVAATGLVLSAPDANACGNDDRDHRSCNLHQHQKQQYKQQKKWNKRHGRNARFERDRRPQYRVVYKWVWNASYRNWEWKAVYEPIYYAQYEYDYGGGHDHPFPEHDGHQHGNDGSCRF